jgi:siderophore synthetase component
MATKNSSASNERMQQTGGDQFVPPYTIPPEDAPFLRNIRTGEIVIYHDTYARMGGQMFEPWSEAPEWLERRTRINEAKAAAALEAMLAEQAQEEEAYMRVQQRQAAIETGVTKSMSKARRDPFATTLAPVSAE